ncbi:hypothetical protein [Actinokineospora enzanensis]|uniref:hypothetical protein n=1 Tax=Actinokineospora enzanensis TaxID=155975 RepID=UPI0012EB55CE|nr:hypothetical protein [Actinokineospora enzanensis]
MLQLGPVECPKCHTTSEQGVQFYFGGCHLDEFRIGDRLRWGSGYDRGKPGHRLVVTLGLGGDCPGCGGPYAPPPICDPGQWDVFIEDDVITHAQWATGEFDYQRDAEPDPDAEFIVLDDYPEDIRRQVDARRKSSPLDGRRPSERPEK